VKLLVGLGNPGPKYELTRHNAGFLVLDLLAERFGIEWQGSRFDGIWTKGEIYGVPCVLLKPQTFMNRSGKSVVAAARFFKVEPQDIVVIYDDIDLDAGKVKAREGGGAGGHNGIKSIIADSGQAGFHRIKIGIGRPTHETAPNGIVSDWVLGPMAESELLALQNEVLKDVELRLKFIFERPKQGTVD
jgi:PTH1 family peptidyl-tRNA hydrolase